MFTSPPLLLLLLLLLILLLPIHNQHQLLSIPPVSPPQVNEQEKDGQLRERLEEQAASIERQEGYINEYKGRITLQQRAIEDMREQQAKQILELKVDHEKALRQAKEDFQNKRRAMQERQERLIEGMKEQQAKQVSKLKDDHERALEQTRENFQQMRREMHARYVTSIALERASVEEATSAQINELLGVCEASGEWEVERASLMSRITSSTPGHNNGGSSTGGGASSSSPFPDMEDNSSRASSSTTFTTIATVTDGDSSNTSTQRDISTMRATPSHLTTTMHYSQSSLEPEEEIDVEDFTNKWGVWRSFVELQKQKEKKLLSAPTRRHAVVMPLFEVLGGSGEMHIKGLCYLYHPLTIDGFKGEEVLDYGGATHEVFSLFFEQLQEVSAVVRVGGRGQAGFDMSFQQLFQTVGADDKGDGGITQNTTFLPMAVVEGEASAIQNTPATKQMYFDVGRVMAKAIIEGCPIPPCCVGP